jgi:hypothetical protein
VFAISSIFLDRLPRDLSGLLFALKDNCASAATLDAAFGDRREQDIGDAAGSAATAGSLSPAESPGPAALRSIR